MAEEDEGDAAMEREMREIAAGLRDCLRRLQRRRKRKQEEEEEEAAGGGGRGRKSRRSKEIERLVGIQDEPKFGTNF